MHKLRIENQPEDFKRIGVDPKEVAVWEDGRRDDDRPGAYEWWYFDFIMDDDTRVVMDLHTKPVMQGASPVQLPQIAMNISLPDGRALGSRNMYPADDLKLCKDHCDVSCGPFHVEGNLKEYKLHFDPIDGVGADLTLTSLSKPWRPGNGYVDFGDGEYFTWLCVVPKGEVSGTLTYEGKTIEVHGFGYHDHQWLCIDPRFAYNHWLWGRQSFEDYAMLVFDITAGKKYGYQKVTMTFIQDKDGNVVFECTDSDKVKYEVFEEYQQESTGKLYPKRSKYTFESDGKKVELNYDVYREVENIDSYNSLPDAAKAVLDAHELMPTYARCAAVGDLTFDNGEEVIHRSSNMHYEFVYMGKKYRNLIP